MPPFLSKMKAEDDLRSEDLRFEREEGARPLTIGNL
jgi:hypothetical protein